MYSMILAAADSLNVSLGDRARAALLEEDLLRKDGAFLEKGSTPNKIKAVVFDQEHKPAFDVTVCQSGAELSELTMPAHVPEKNTCLMVKTRVDRSVRHLVIEDDGNLFLKLEQRLNESTR